MLVTNCRASGGSNLPPGNVSSFSAAGGDGTVTLTWQDPADYTPNWLTEPIAVWAGTRIVRKEGGDPADERDGVVVVDSTVRNQYASSGYIDSGLTNNVTYYYQAFPRSDKGIVNRNAANRVSAKPQIGAIALSALPTGSLVKFAVNGADRQFIVVHRGKPASNYGNSLNGGTILMMRDIYTSMRWMTGVNIYQNSDIHAYLNGAFLTLIKSSVRAQLIQAKLPHRNSAGDHTVVQSGESGLPAYVWTPSYIELGMSPTSTTPLDGATFAYFNNAINATRIAYHNGIATTYFTRTNKIINDQSVYTIDARGGESVAINTDTHGIRPTLVLPNALTVSPTPDLNGAYTLLTA